MSAKNVKPESETKTKNSTTSNRLFVHPDPSKPLENLLPDYTLRLPGGKSSAPTVTDVSPSQRISSAVNAKLSKHRPSLLPVEGILAGVAAMEFGAQKYAVNDWRTNDKVTRDALLDAIGRHYYALLQGETHAPDSQVHHLGHIIAGASMLLARFEEKE